MDLVSVIIPYYKKRKFISETVDSAVNQSYKNLINHNIKFASLSTKEDFVLWLRLLKNNVNIYGLNEDLALWTKSKNSLSSSTFQKIIDGFRVYYTYMNFGFIKSIYYLICLSINFLKK